MQPAPVYDVAMPSHLKRYHTEGNYHFLTFSCYRRFPYLGDDRSRTVFLDTLESLRQRHCFFVFGYVLMPEHVHLLLSEPSLQRLDNTLRVLKGQTSKLLTEGFTPAVLAEPILRLQRLHPSQVCREGSLHPQEPGYARSGRETGRLPLVQLSSLGYRGMWSCRD